MANSGLSPDLSLCGSSETLLGPRTLIMELKGSHHVILEGAEVNRNGVGGASNHLAFHQEGLIGQGHQAPMVHSPDGEHFPIRQVHAFHLEAGRDGESMWLIREGCSIVRLQPKLERNLVMFVFSRSEPKAPPSGIRWKTRGPSHSGQPKDPGRSPIAEFPIVRRDILLPFVEVPFLALRTNKGPASQCI